MISEAVLPATVDLCYILFHTFSTFSFFDIFETSIEKSLDQMSSCSSGSGSVWLGSALDILDTLN